MKRLAEYAPHETRYQAGHTLGRRLLEGAREVNILGFSHAV